MSALDFLTVRERIERLVGWNRSWGRFAPNLLAAFGNDRARFDEATDAEVGYEVGRLVEYHAQRRRAGAAHSARKAQASRLNGRKGGRPRKSAQGVAMSEVGSDCVPTATTNPTRQVPP